MSYAEKHWQLTLVLLEALFRDAPNVAVEDMMRIATAKASKCLNIYEGDRNERE
jgi:hypothetical protein